VQGTGRATEAELALAYGSAIGRPNGARRSPVEFRCRIGKAGNFSWLQPDWFDRIMPRAAFTLSRVRDA
jgi:hypothetical protein